MKSEDWNKEALEQFKLLDKELSKVCDKEPDNHLCYILQIGSINAIKKGLNNNIKLKAYAKRLAKNYTKYVDYQYNGKNGANSDNEKGYWRGMADSVVGILTIWKKDGLIEHLGILNDPWPEE